MARSRLAAQRVARKYVNLMDRVEAAPHTPVPAFTSITRVDTGVTESFTREKSRPAGAFWEEYNDFVLGDLVRSGLLGQ